MDCKNWQVSSTWAIFLKGVKKISVLSKNNTKRFLVVFICFFCMPFFVCADDTQKYSQTIDVLKALYKDETTACLTYSAFAKKAKEEGYVNVARLFFALQSSETIHARNFKHILQTLGIGAVEEGRIAVEIGDTKKNLQHALAVELSEIDNNYPGYIKKVKREGHKEAIAHMTYAWKSEKQHRFQLRQMKGALPLFFSTFDERLEAADTYFVCQECGSTLTVLPERTCPICGSTVSNYKEIAALESPTKAKE